MKEEDSAYREGRLKAGCSMGLLATEISAARKWIGDSVFHHRSVWWFFPLGSRPRLLQSTSQLLTGVHWSGHVGWAGAVLMKTKPPITGWSAAVSSTGEHAQTHTHTWTRSHQHSWTPALLFSSTTEDCHIHLSKREILMYRSKYLLLCLQLLSTPASSDPSRH